MPETVPDREARPPARFSAGRWLGFLFLAGLAPATVALGQTACPVEPPPAMATYALRPRLFEAAAPGTPPVSFDAVHLDRDLLSRAVAFTNLPIFARGSAVAALESGHRPLGYQQHLYALKQTWAKLSMFCGSPRGWRKRKRAGPCWTSSTPTSIGTGSPGQAALDGIPRVSPPRASDHTSVPARRWISPSRRRALSDSEIDALAALVG